MINQTGQPIGSSEYLLQHNLEIRYIINIQPNDIKTDIIYAFIIKRPIKN